MFVFFAVLHNHSHLKVLYNIERKVIPVRAELGYGGKEGVCFRRLQKFEFWTEVKWRCSRCL